ncbi:DUF1540 domain-containing protein [Fodinisporobacter ferrooxydans]|uniref:DUF1540 domain-containing protein n=1 Tax=Fodinisporobacter ferrooxydans TaxID=2901836 RepID=A0ABY4CP31_9BACL|nr:DUF1540 domain-containing protein [Alicyclobacillaceae bacterium MYW30-H2]
MATQMEMLQRIKCTVESCSFNDNQACSASSIEVNLNPVLTDPNSEFAAELGSFGTQTSEATMCRTYKPKNKA